MVVVVVIAVSSVAFAVGVGGRFRVLEGELLLEIGEEDGLSVGVGCSVRVEEDHAIVSD